MNALRVHVERAVRPIRANGLRKDRMREELLAHLTGVFEEELERLGDEGGAAREAIRRFGGAQDVSQELQAAVPRVEQLLHANLPGLGQLDHVFAPRVGESRRRLAWRMAAWQTLAGTAMVASVVAVAAIVREDQLLPRLVTFAAGAVLLFCGGHVLLSAVLAPEMSRAMDRVSADPRAWLGLAGWCVLSGIVVAMLGLGGAGLINWYGSAAVFRPDQWWILLLVALGGQLGLVAYTWGWTIELRRFRRWGRLKVD